MPVTNKWEIIGWAGVDSGTLLIVDPCYVLPKEDDPDDKPNHTYESLFKGYFDGDYGKRVLAKEAIFSGVGGNGTVFNTYSGDGNYPIVGLIETSEQGYKNIRRVVVDLDWTFCEEQGLIDKDGNLILDK